MANGHFHTSLNNMRMNKTRPGKRRNGVMLRRQISSYIAYECCFVSDISLLLQTLCDDFYQEECLYHVIFASIILYNASECGKL